MSTKPTITRRAPGFGGACVAAGILAWAAAGTIVAGPNTPTAAPPSERLGREGVVLEGVTLSNTEGTLRMQEIKARRVDISGDNKVAFLSEMSAVIRAKETTGTAVLASAPRGEVIIAGKASKGDPAPLTADSIERLATDEPSKRWKSDFVLRGDGPDGPSPVKLDFRGRGDVHTGMVVWSEEYQRLVAPTAFRQTGVAQGGELKITGGAFAADRAFGEWVYFATTENPFVLEFTPSGTPTGPAAGK